MPDENSQKIDDARRRRVQRLKKIIIVVLVLAISIPYLVGAVLLVQLVRTGRDLKNANAQIEELKNKSSELNSEIQEHFNQMQEEIERLQKQMDEVPEQPQTKESTAKHKVYLTFDDGPSNNTDDILDVLKKYDVKATFFVVGKEDEISAQRMKRIVDEGHTLGMHSYSHKYSELYESEENFREDLDQIRTLVERVTGSACIAYRFPGGSSNTVSKVEMMTLAQILSEEGITFYDWNISSGDAKSNVPSVETLVENSTSDIEKWENSVVLLHDTGNKDRTVEALPYIIEKILSMEDTEILPITAETVPVQHIHPEE